MREIERERECVRERTREKKRVCVRDSERESVCVFIQRMSIHLDNK